MKKGVLSDSVIGNTKTRIIQRAFNRFEISSKKFCPEKRLVNGSFQVKMAAITPIFNMKVSEVDLGGFGK